MPINQQQSADLLVLVRWCRNALFAPPFGARSRNKWKVSRLQDHKPIAVLLLLPFLFTRKLQLVLFPSQPSISFRSNRNGDAWVVPDGWLPPTFTCRWIRLCFTQFNSVDVSIPHHSLLVTYVEVSWIPSWFGPGSNRPHPDFTTPRFTRGPNYWDMSP